MCWNLYPFWWLPTSPASFLLVDFWGPRPALFWSILTVLCSYSPLWNFVGLYVSEDIQFGAKRHIHNFFWNMAFLLDLIISNLIILCSSGTQSFSGGLLLCKKRKSSFSLSWYLARVCSYHSVGKKGREIGGQSKSLGQSQYQRSREEPYPCDETMTWIGMQWKLKNWCQ